MMQKPPLDPDVADAAPDDPVLTTYDEQHLVTYWRLLDAEADGAEWTEVARIVLHIDPDREPSRARSVFDSHLARAKWMADHGYRDLLRGGTIK
jgi:T6SS, Transcription factor, DNA binding domain